MDGSALGWLALGLVSFVGMWIAILVALARIGGWRELAHAYPALGITSAAPGETFRLRSAQLRRGVNYNGCITFTAGPAALRLSLPRVLAFGHPPIEVPWTELSAEAGRLWWMPIVTLRCTRAPAVPLRLQRGLAESLARASGGQLRLPPAGEAR